jgi:hypothetical protein
VRNWTGDRPPPQAPLKSADRSWLQALVDEVTRSIGDHRMSLPNAGRSSVERVRSGDSAGGAAAAPSTAAAAARDRVEQLVGADAVSFAAYKHGADCPVPLIISERLVDDEGSGDVSDGAASLVEDEPSRRQTSQPTSESARQEPAVDPAQWSPSLPAHSTRRASVR